MRISKYQVLKFLCLNRKLIRPIITLLLLLFFVSTMKAENEGLFCDPMGINGSEKICSANLGVTEFNYDVNYKYMTCGTWRVKGGTITRINGRPLSEFIAAQLQKSQIDQSTANATVDYLSGCASDNISLRLSASGTALQQAVVILDPLNLFGYLHGLVADELKTITIIWTDPNGGSVELSATGLGFGGVCGSDDATKYISVTSNLNPNFGLTASSTNVLCSDQVTVSGMPWAQDARYSWYASGGVVASNWNYGIQISKFNQSGIQKVSCTIVSQCDNITRSIDINVSLPTVGNPQQNGHDAMDVIPDCGGNFNLYFPYVAGNPTVTWGYQYLPSPGYVSGSNISSYLPKGSLQDVPGFVTVRVCGTDVTRNFTVKALKSPTIDDNVISCSNTVIIRALNPLGKSCSWWSQNGGTFSNQGCTSATFNAPGPGTYNIHLGTTDVNGCYSDLATIVTIKGGNGDGKTSGWASGVLSDLASAPASNIIPDNNIGVNQKIYFAARDGSMNYYQFNQGAAKWISYSLLGTSDVITPASGSFTKIGMTSVSEAAYLFYLSSAKDLVRINTADNSKTIQANNIIDFTFNGSGTIYSYDSFGNIKVNGNTIKNIPNANLKTVLSSTDLVYLASGNLYRLSISGTNTQLTFTGDILASADVVESNGYLYFARKQGTALDIYRINLSNVSTPERITITANLTGAFTLNQTTGTIYYGTLNSSRTSITTASGTFPDAEVYQAYFKNGIWNFVKATSGSNSTCSDMLICSPVFSNNHLYYVGAGSFGSLNCRVNVSNTSDVEVWNLYFESACTPSVF